jgi:hypothetical protein
MSMNEAFALIDWLMAGLVVLTVLGFILMARGRH